MKCKFDECEGCRYYNRFRANPICGECGNGEFYERRIRNRELTSDELMNIYRRMSDED